MSSLLLNCGLDLRPLAGPSNQNRAAELRSARFHIDHRPSQPALVGVIWHERSPRMDTAATISDEVRGAVRRSYADSQEQLVLDILSTVSNEWARQSILILANGDYRQLCELVELAELDSREIPYRIDPRTFDGLAADELVRRRTTMGLSLPQTHAEINAERLHQNVINFVAEKLIVSIDQLSDATQLQSDLGLAGTDGDRFVRAFADHFDVNLDEYDFRSHFAPKPGDNLWADIKVLVFRRNQPTIIPITVDDLLVTAESHRWMPGSEYAR